MLGTGNCPPHGAHAWFEGAFRRFATFIYVRWFLPETKGKTLEEVQAMWADPTEMHRATHTWR